MGPPVVFMEGQSSVRANYTVQEGHNLVRDDQTVRGVKLQ